MTAKGLPVSETCQVYDNILQTIGNTPLVRLSRIDRNLPCPIYAKIEFFNPGGACNPGNQCTDIHPGLPVGTGKAAGDP